MSHGKGRVDGIGAAKRHVWNMVKTCQNQVTNAISFTSASETMPNVEVIEMTSEMINNTNKELGLDDVFKNAVTLQNIANVHCVTVSWNNINMYTITREQPTPVPCQPEPEEDVHRDIRQKYKQLKKEVTLSALEGRGEGVGEILFGMGVTPA